ncbi:aromatic-ring-hydroxylating dioxygenase subunit beta [Saccharopolyspora sp. NPDC049357]|uniref:aromatic-ring-hydroxylating dioxygenase subunit beta n=1 Tax=Saccharopolyspora sp. NPDC049357 TaxID=3154507 RepID=UPI00341F64B6
MTDVTEPATLATAPVPTTDPRVARAIELIWREAELLDRKDYGAWNDLFTDDGIYVVPIQPDTDDFAGTLNMIYDDARMRRMRVTRMIEGYAIAAVDAARTVRTVSRFVPESVSDGEVVLRSAQVLIAYKRGRHDVWAADVVHRIRLSDEGSEADRVVLKVVRLVDSEDVVPAAGFLL